MSLIKCPECGKMISDRSNVCIHCGYPIIEMKAIDESTEEKESSNKELMSNNYSHINNQNIVLKDSNIIQYLSIIKNIEENIYCLNNLINILPTIYMDIEKPIKPDKPTLSDYDNYIMKIFVMASMCFLSLIGSIICLSFEIFNWGGISNIYYCGSSITINR